MESQLGGLSSEVEFHREGSSTNRANLLVFFYIVLHKEGPRCGTNALMVGSKFHTDMISKHTKRMVELFASA